MATATESTADQSAEHAPVDAAEESLTAVLLDPDTIVRDACNAREHDTEPDEDLINSVKAVEVQDPISVRPRPDGTYGAFKGWRRTQAAQIANATAEAEGRAKHPIKAFVRADLVGRDAWTRFLSLIENHQREGMSTKDTLKAAELSLIGMDEVEQKAAARALGLKRGTGQRLARAQELSDAALRRASAGGMDLEQMATFAEVADVPDSEHRLLRALARDEDEEDGGRGHWEQELALLKAEQTDRATRTEAITALEQAEIPLLPTRVPYGEKDTARPLTDLTTGLGNPLAEDKPQELPRPQRPARRRAPARVVLRRPGRLRPQGPPTAQEAPHGAGRGEGGGAPQGHRLQPRLEGRSRPPAGVHHPARTHEGPARCNACLRAGGPAHRPRLLQHMDRQAGIRGTRAVPGAQGTPARRPDGDRRRPAQGPRGERSVRDRRRRLRVRHPRAPDLVASHELAGPIPAAPGGARPQRQGLLPALGGREAGGLPAPECGPRHHRRRRLSPAASPHAHDGRAPTGARPPHPALTHLHTECLMSTSSAAEPAPQRRDQPLTLAVLRRLVGNDWSRMPDTTLVVLSTDPEGNGFSPFSTYARARYAPEPEGDDLRGEVYPLESELARDAELRSLFPQVPDSAVAALVLYPLG